ncbi:hypothetical protein DACRYDRAFT_116736 [Dacryopinax primogenitus]|uniref:Protein kinase domain-containing protein n=1 Tax=Dacryopinax primogenitus (strain DJM 731) TaxID=1858805 RepID=M5FV53_DACPD|nr:uncharacterized protein DACRYDRAFT_116736 [Dacryopinax primogenitus]EJU01651.1 hypothetical protein DACRYDRAFT_116736 [Dacryopinax primogenitus]
MAIGDEYHVGHVRASNQQRYLMEFIGQTDQQALGILGLQLLRLATEHAFSETSSIERTRIPPPLLECIVETLKPIVSMFGASPPPEAGPSSKSPPASKGGSKTRKSSKPTSSTRTASSQSPPSVRSPLHDTVSVSSTPSPASSIPDNGRSPMVRIVERNSNTYDARSIVGWHPSMKNGDHVSLTRKIGAGLVADAYRGEYNGRPIVAKIVSNHQEEKREALCHEAEIYMPLQAEWGRAVPSFMGLFEGQKKSLLLLSYEGQPIPDMKSHWHDIGSLLRRIHLSIEHNDVAERNILQNADGRLCLIGFHAATRHAGHPCTGRCKELRLHLLRSKEDSPDHVAVDDWAIDLGANWNDAIAA